jgi:hypothetical protein
VDKLVKDRQEAFEKEASGENDFESSYSMAVDEWINVVDNHKAVVKARKEAVSQIDQDTENADQWQQEQMLLWSDRNELRCIICKRKASEQQDLDDDDEENSQPFKTSNRSQDWSAAVDSVAPSPTNTYTTLTPTPGTEGLQSRL